MMRIRHTILAIAAMSLCFGTTSAFAQLSISRGQRPGEMVNGGVFRAQEFGRPVQITATSRPGSIRTDLFVQAVDLIVTQINQAVDAFAALLVLRAGGVPAIPSLPDTTALPDTSTQPRRKAVMANKSPHFRR